MDFMNLNFITDYYIPVVLVACLCVGYCIKHITWLDTIGNQYIPTIMLILGSGLACLAMNNITLDILVAGAVTGLASTGLHQMFTQVIDGKKEKFKL